MSILFGGEPRPEMLRLQPGVHLSGVLPYEEQPLRVVFGNKPDLFAPPNRSNPDGGVLFEADATPYVTKAQSLLVGMDHEPFAAVVVIGEEPIFADVVDAAVLRQTQVENVPGARTEIAVPSEETALALAPLLNQYGSVGEQIVCRPYAGREEAGIYEALRGVCRTDGPIEHRRPAAVSPGATGGPAAAGPVKVRTAVGTGPVASRRRPRLQQ